MINIALAAQLALDGEGVTYTKHDDLDNPISLEALRAQTPFRESTNGNHGSRIVRSADFLFEAAAFHAAVGRWPEDGDKLTVAPPAEISGIASITYRVTPFNGEPPCRLDAGVTQLRVHTQEFAES